MAPLELLCWFFAGYLPPLERRGGLMLLPDAWPFDWNVSALVQFALVKRCVYFTLLPLLRPLMFRLEMDELMHNRALNDRLHGEEIHDDDADSLASQTHWDSLDRAEADEALMTRQEQHLDHLDALEPFEYLPELPEMQREDRNSPRDVDLESACYSSPADDLFECGPDQLEQGYRWGSAVQQLYHELEVEGDDTIYGR
jgi:hypothetical protein